MRQEILYTIDTWEGGATITDIVEDTGGQTKFGISKAAYPRLDIPSLTLEEAVAIYEKDYWDRLRCSDIKSIRVRWKLFDIAVNMGVLRAAILAQRAVGINPQDGSIGPITLGKINEAVECELLHDLSMLQAARYGEIVISNLSQIKFLRGWLRRAADIGKNIKEVT